MRINNKTKWNTRQLRSLLCEALRRNEKVEGKLDSWKRKHLTVDCVPARNKRWCSGRAVLNGTWMKIRIPSVPFDNQQKEIAWVFIHELYHNRGHHHSNIGQMRHRPNWNEPQPEWDWAMSYPLNLMLPVAKPKKDVQLVRFTHVQKMVAKKKQQLRRIQGQLNRWLAKERYYINVLSAAHKLPNNKETL